MVGWFLPVSTGSPSYLQGPRPTNKPFQSSDLLSSGVSEAQVTCWLPLLSSKTQAGVCVGSGGGARDKPSLLLLQKDKR